MKIITSSDFDKEVLQAELPTMVCYSASWCGPCKAMQSIYEEVAKIIEGKANIVKLDIDDSPDIASQYKVKSIPTMLVFNKGQLIATQVGSTSKSVLLSLFPKG